MLSNGHSKINLSFLTLTLTFNFYVTIVVKLCFLLYCIPYFNSRNNIFYLLILVVVNSKLNLSLYGFSTVLLCFDN